MKSATERFYDDFARQFVRDYVLGNRRVERQLAFLGAAVPATAARVLIIGCGSGESARFIAARIARQSEVLAIDISSEALRLARALHAHPRVTYKQLDVLADPLDGTFDVVILPDAYEHIPSSERTVLHDKLEHLLNASGRLLLTIPSPAKQAALAAAREGLQIIDEVVTTRDLMALANDVHGELTYVNLISVWQANDYMHAAITRDTDRVAALTASTRLQVQPASRCSLAEGIDGGGHVRQAARLVRAGFRYLELRLRLRHTGGLPSRVAESRDVND